MKKKCETKWPNSLQAAADQSLSDSPPVPVAVLNEGKEDAPSLDELDFEENSDTHERQKSYFSSPKRYFLLALCLWLIEVSLVISLKRLGFIEKEFRLEDAMTQGVLHRLNESLPPIPYLTPEKKRPGFLLAEQGATAEYPVVMIPGFVTSGLELWSGHECAKRLFRQRLWAALTGARTLLLERDCWRDHIMLDPVTGGDPEGVRLRAAQGFEAADYFLGNYWVWGKLIHNLADVGYTPSNMSLEAYDWRLSFPMLEKRDGYLTKLKYKIEAMHKASGKRVVIASHSMGSLLIHYFFAWVTTSEKRGGGGGGKRWVDEHIHTYISIAGPNLGVAKASSALLSGEMKDTIFTGQTMGNLAEQFFGRRRRRDLWNTWGSLWAMLPKGGNALWSIGADMCSSRSAEDPFCSEHKPSPLITVQHPTETNITPSASETTNTNDFATTDHEVESVLAFLQGHGAGLGPNTAASRDFSLFGPERDSGRVWHDPTRTPLPHAPNMRIFCLYGVGIDTERAYYYRQNLEPRMESEEADVSDLPVVLDPSVENVTQKTHSGIRYTNGDGSVPLLSLGYLCADAWRRADSGLNPSRTEVITREYPNKSEFSVDDPMRSGPRSAEHVDILGNIDMTEDFLRVVTDFEIEKVATNHIVSDIIEVADRINSHPAGGIRRKRRWLDIF